MMVLRQIYADKRFLELSDQIENASRLIQAHLKELNEKFPPDRDYKWVVNDLGVPRCTFTGEIG